MTPPDGPAQEQVAEGQNGFTADINGGYAGQPIRTNDNNISDNGKDRGRDLHFGSGGLFLG